MVNLVAKKSILNFFDYYRSDWASIARAYQTLAPGSRGSDGILGFGISYAIEDICLDWADDGHRRVTECTTLFQ